MKNRNMFYQNMQTTYSNPGMFIPPSGYNMNSEYQAYGPNIMANNQEYEERLNRIEKQIKVLDNRLQKLENASIDKTTDNFYMI